MKQHAMTGDVKAPGKVGFGAGSLTMTRSTNDGRETEGPMTERGQTGDSREMRLPESAQGKIAQQLRDAYGQLLSEPMPDKFAQLLQKLAKPEENS